MSDDHRSLQTQELDIRTLVGVVNDTGAFIYSKDLSGSYTYANKLVLDMFELPLAEVVGKRDDDFYDLSTSKKVKENERAVLEHGETVEIEETFVLRSTGDRRIYLSVKKPLRDSDGKITGLFGISTDITKRKRLEITVHEQKEFLDAILNNVDAYIFMKDINRTYRYANAKFASLYGTEANGIIGKRDTELMTQEVADQLWQLDQKVFETNQKQTGEEVLMHPNGQLRRYLSTKIPFKLDDNTPTSIGFATDITELYLLKEKLQKQAITDALTGLYNRRYFNDQCEREYSRCRRMQKTMSIIIIDIDYFKKINDQFGHPMGDKVLREVSKIYKSCLRKENILCRIGGEEFAILLPDTSRQAATVLAERIRLTQEAKPIPITAEINAKPTISLGVSTLLEDDESFNDLLGRADRALYKAKQQGRNQVRVL